MKGRTSTSSSFFFPQWKGVPFFLKTIAFSLYLQIASCGEMRWLNPRNRHSPVSESLRERERKEKRTTSYISKMLGSRGANKRLCTRDTHMVRKWEYTWQGKKTDGLLRSFVIEGVLKEKVSLSLVPPDRVPWRETNARWLVSWRSV